MILSAVMDESFKIIHDAKYLHRIRLTCNCEKLSNLSPVDLRIIHELSQKWFKELTSDQYFH